MRKARPCTARSMRERLAALSFDEACALLGEHGRPLLLKVGSLELAAENGLQIDEQSARAEWKDDAVRVVSRFTFAAASDALIASCTHCTMQADTACVHVAGLISLVLERNSERGLSVPSVQADSEEALVAKALAERAKRAETETMTVTSTNPKVPWTDYTVLSALSGKTYRVALRSDVRGESYCSCPDFKTNTLGTCKHIMRVRAQKFAARLWAKAYLRTRITVHLRYEQGIALALALPQTLPASVTPLLARLGPSPLAVEPLVRCLARLSAIGQAFFVTPDAEEFIQRSLQTARMSKLVAEIRQAPAAHPLRTGLLREPLLPYQLDGIAFACGAGRAILADEMGLGKTIQGVGAAEFLARELDIHKVLIVCPASLKAQWQSEIGRFSNRSSEVASGDAQQRNRVYEGDAFFTIANYEQVLHDIGHIERTRWDLIILDEGQRIKNWEAKTSRVVKGLSSRFALVLSGTPLENRLDDLHSIVEFVDPHLLGPSFRFLHRHQVRDADGKLQGVKHLDELRKRLKFVLLRRTRESVQLELPPRTVEIVRIAASPEQLVLHEAHMRTVSMIVRKPHLTDIDLLRLRAALLMCRMAANSTYLVDKKAPGTSSKLERLADLLDAVAAEPTRKVVVFSEWTSMLDLIEPLLLARNLGFVRLDGQVPQRKRQALVDTFQRDPAIRIFLTTNAGSTGLNLQAANTIINVDLPWNPAVLEQRIARAHRMGQKRPVTVFVLVTEHTLEESLLSSLAAKRDLAMAALDADSQIDTIELRSQSDQIRQRVQGLMAVPSTLTASIVDVQPNDQNSSVDLTKLVPQIFDPKIIQDHNGEMRLSLAIPKAADVAEWMQKFTAFLAAEGRPRG